MKLNAGIIFEHLRSRFDVELHGTVSSDLHLSRPAFYMAPQNEFKADCLYLASADHLPARPTIRKNTVLVVVGDSLTLPYYLKRCTVLQVRGKPDFFSVYLAIQEIFDHYDEWNDELFDLFKSDADIQKIVDCSARAFDRSVIVIDSSFHVLAFAGDSMSERQDLWKDASEHLSSYSLEHFLAGNHVKTEEHSPMFLKIVDSNALCVNLFDAHDSYIGCLCILVAEDHLDLGADALAIYLARILEKSIEKNPAVLVTERNTLKSILQDLVNGRPIASEQRWLIDTASSGDSRFVCVSLHALGAEQALPQNYLCNSFEVAFPDSYALNCDDSVVCVVNLSAIGCSPENHCRAIDVALSPFINPLKLNVGISNDFDDLGKTPVYAKQSQIAYDNGSLLQPSENCHHFMDYALMDLVINSLSGASTESYFPYELRRIMEHDGSSSVSYLETLQVFLAEGMNYSQAAKRLFVHRSTLVDRINKIEKEYGLNLHDPDSRLYLELLLKAIETEQRIKAFL